MKQQNFRYYQSIGANIGKYRRERKMTQEQLAELADRSVPYISHLECALKVPSVDTLIAIAEALCVPLDWLSKMEEALEVQPKNCGRD